MARLEDCTLISIYLRRNQSLPLHREEAKRAPGFQKNKKKGLSLNKLVALDLSETCLSWKGEVAFPESPTPGNEKTERRKGGKL